MCGIEVCLDVTNAGITDIHYYFHDKSIYSFCVTKVFMLCRLHSIVLFHSVPLPETQPPPTTTAATTNTTGIPTGGANTGATAAAVVVILIILIASIVIATVVFVFLVKKHKSPKRVHSIGNPKVVQDGIGEFIIHLVRIIKMCVLTNLLIRYVHVFFVAL